jgi:transketolase
MIVKGDREQFAEALHYLMGKDRDIILITADMGYKMLDKIRDDYPDQYYNVGAAEQVMMDMAVGFALSGKRVVTYTITPFYFRTFETLRTYINHESIPILMVGSGRDDDYQAGISHYAGDDTILGELKNIVIFKQPEDDSYDLKEIIYSGKPTYLNLRRN